MFGRGLDCQQLEAQDPGLLGINQHEASHPVTHQPTSPTHPAPQQFVFPSAGSALGLRRHCADASSNGALHPSIIQEDCQLQVQELLGTSPQPILMISSGDFAIEFGSITARTPTEGQLGGGATAGRKLNLGGRYSLDSSGSGYALPRIQAAALARVKTADGADAGNFF